MELSRRQFLKSSAGMASAVAIPNPKKSSEKQIILIGKLTGTSSLSFFSGEAYLSENNIAISERKSYALIPMDLVISDLTELDEDIDMTIHYETDFKLAEQIENKEFLG